MKKPATDMAEMLVDHQADDVVVLNVGDISSIADYFVIATGATKHHLTNLAERLVRSLRAQNQRVLRREGRSDGGWIVLDYGETVVHLMTKEQRESYNMESLWSKAKVVARYVS